MRSCVLALFVALTLSSAALAGGGGENMILVVNPNDENSLRIANAYAQLRSIPDSNIIFDIAPPVSGGYAYTSLSKQQVKDLYITPLANIIQQRGLTHIDYISVLGQATAYTAPAYFGWDTRDSLTYALSLLTPFSNGLDTDFGRKHSSQLYQLAQATPSNTAIHHSTVYNGSFQNPATYQSTSVPTQYYMAGATGFTAFGGNTADQVIANLQRTVAADGTKPVGTIYFEENDDVRSNTREPEWPGTKSDLTARGINYIEERNTSGSTPLNRSDVRGAVIGRAGYTIPNGSTYLPGSYADNLTSYGSTFDNRSQTKDTSFIRAGAAGTSGTVTEPYADSARFSNSDIFVQIADGSTLGEAAAKSIQTPDLQMFIGDSLAQPYADVPHVNVTGITDHQTVTGSIQFNAAASLVSPTVATGIKQLNLYIDGKLTGSPILNADGLFNLDTTGLSDGTHEVRVAALNNAPAESSGSAIRNIVVNNHNRSVLVTTGNINLDATQVAPVAVNANAGDGSVARIELRQLGRVLGSINSAAGNINIDASQLAYGDNPVVPVAVYADGSQVAGDTITVHRNTPPLQTGNTPTDAQWRTPGAKVEFFNNKGNTSIAASDFTGTPDRTMQASSLDLFSGRTYVNSSDGKTYNRSRLDSSTPVSMNIDAAGLNFDKLAVRADAKFQITSANTGEYEFYFYNTNDSAQLFIDGRKILGFDNSPGGKLTQFVPGLFLGTGEHDLLVLAANMLTTWNPDYFDISLMYRGPDGITRIADSSFLYTVPEPASITLLAMTAIVLIRRRKP
ncbi:MAG: TIGR03790 family protein [Phycisphaerales bacterium]